MNVSRVIQSWNERKKNENLILSYDSMCLCLFWVHNKIDKILRPPKKPPFAFDGHDTGFP